LSQTERPLPQPTYYSQEYWDAARRQELRLQQCDRCGHIRFYPSPVCSNCTAFEHRWVQVSGRGQVLTYTVIHRPPSAFFADKVPYALILVKLDEGPVMMANLLNALPEAAAIDMRVRVVFEVASDEITLPQFEPDLDAAPSSASGGGRD